MTQYTLQEESWTTLEWAEQEGIDLSLLRERLKLSPTQRLEAHKRALASLLSFVSEVDHARHRGHSQSALRKRG